MHLTEFPGDGDVVIFSGSDSVNGRQIWEANSSSGGELLDVVNPNGDADPDNLTAAANSFYYTATAPDPGNGGNPAVLLFWTDGVSGDLTVVDNIEDGTTYYPVNATQITPALDSSGNGAWVYFVADGYVDTGDGSGLTFHSGILWAVNNAGPNVSGTIDAVPILDANHHVITGARNLKGVVDAGGESYFRLYFSRDANDGLGPQVWETE
jgi:hypothetical protein